MSPLPAATRRYSSRCLLHLDSAGSRTFACGSNSFESCLPTAQKAASRPTSPPRSAGRPRFSTIDKNSKTAPRSQTPDSQQSETSTTLGSDRSPDSRYRCTAAGSDTSSSRIRRSKAYSDLRRDPSSYGAVDDDSPTQSDQRKSRRRYSRSSQP